MKIRHIVIINFKKNAHENFASLLEQTIPLIQEIPGVLSYKIFQNESRYVAEGITSFGAEIIFENQEALDLFMNHPKHYEANALFEEYFADPPFMVLTYPLV